MRLFLFLFLSLSLSLAKDFCIKEVENPYAEVYLSYAFRKGLERAVLESGNRLRCGDGAQEIKPYIELMREVPIAYTPQQRVSAYNLELRVGLTVGEVKKVFSTSVPYSQTTGGVGDLPRRGAIQDAFGIIYIDMLEFIKELEEKR